MRLAQLRPHYFRAFGDNSAIRFSDNLTIFLGGNGSGKSSLAEALEWLFFGYTKRRRKGDEYSKNEYKGSYVHSACPIGEVPYAEATVVFPDGLEHLLKRTISLDTNGYPIDDSSEISFDGTRIQDFSDVGIIYNEAHCPIVVQHGIQDFIHTRPIDRYRSISEALGIADLVGFKDILEKSKNRYRKELPERVVQAQNSLRQLTSSLRTVGLNDIASRWARGEVEVPSDYLVIQDKARELSSSSAENIEILLQDVKLRQSIEISKVFDITPYRITPNSLNLFTQLNNAFVDLKDELGHLLLTASDLSGIAVSMYLGDQLELWGKGIELIKETGIFPDEDETYTPCPFCGESTINKSLIDTIQKRIEGNQYLSTKQNEFNERIDSSVSKLDEIIILLNQLNFHELNDQEFQRLKPMFSRYEDQLIDFVQGNRTSALQLSKFKGIVDQMKRNLLTLKRQNIQPTNATQVIEPFKNIGKQIETEINNTRNSLNLYSTKFSTFHPILEQELSDEQTVTIFTVLINLLTVRPQIDIVLAARQFDTEIVEAQRIADEYIFSMQTNILNTREAEILGWYGKLSPNPEVKFSGLEPGRNSFGLKAIAFGRSLNAAASLSQSQLNCLGLSIYIPSIIARESVFQFIVFDDPVQAMDDDHHEAFLLKVVPELLDDFDRQVIVLTHLKHTADRLRNLNYDRCPLYYKFDNLQPGGPQISEYIQLKEELRAVRSLAAGNEDNRKLAVDRVRPICETIMREAHIKIVHSEMPDRYRDGRSMLSQFRILPGIDTRSCQNLADSIGWSDPSHHTDPTWQVPDTGSINLHVDRLYSIINNLDLRC
ncbi:AAA family ATPase [Chloroflexota bacterium]